MASYADVVRAKSATLVANTVDTVTFATNYGSAEVTNRATTGAGIWFRTDGTAPTVAGDDAYWVGAGQSLTVDLGSADSVKLISATADAYTVTGVR